MATSKIIHTGRHFPQGKWMEKSNVMTEKSRWTSMTWENFHCEQTLITCENSESTVKISNFHSIATNSWIQVQINQLKGNIFNFTEGHWQAQQPHLRSWCCFCRNPKKFCPAFNHNIQLCVCVMKCPRVTESLFCSAATTVSDSWWFSHSDFWTQCWRVLLSWPSSFCVSLTTVLIACASLIGSTSLSLTSPSLCTQFSSFSSL